MSTLAIWLRVAEPIALGRVERASLLRLYESDMRRAAFVPRLRAQQLPELKRYVDAGNREALIMWHHFPAAEAARIVARELAHFASVGDFAWKIYDGDQPDLLAALLSDAGLRARENASLLVQSTHDLSALSLAQALGPEIEIRVLTRREEVELLRSVWQSVWPNESHGWLAVLAEAIEAQSDQLKILIALFNGAPVSSGYVILDPRGNFAYLGGGATVAPFRGRGIYRALIDARLRLAAAANIGHVAVEANAASSAVLQRLGFQVLTTLQIFARS